MVPIPLGAKSRKLQPANRVLQETRRDYKTIRALPGKLLIDQEPPHGKGREEQTYQEQLEHDFVVAPGADPHAITLNFAGAEESSVDGQGSLVLAIQHGEVRLEKPRSRGASRKK